MDSTALLLRSWTGVGSPVLGQRSCAPRHMCCDAGGRAGKRHADRNTGKIVIPSTIRSQASAGAGPWRRGCSSITCRPGHPVTLAWPGRAPRSGGSGARRYCGSTWRAEREGEPLRIRACSSAICATASSWRPGSTPRISTRPTSSSRSRLSRRLACNAMRLRHAAHIGLAGSGSTGHTTLTAVQGCVLGPLYSPVSQMEDCGIGQRR
jgi:hypothetical protein